MFDIDLPQIRGARGRRRGAGPQPQYVRDLAVQDLAAIQDPSPVGSEPRPLQALRERHHAIARLVAEGRKGVEIAAMLGVSQSRLSILKSDPAFQELVQYYHAQKEAVYVDVHERLAQVGGTALAIIQDRLEDEGQDMSTRELQGLVEMAFDRSVAPALGAAKGQGTGAGGAVNVQVNFVPASQTIAPPQQEMFATIRQDATDAKVLK